MILTLITLPLFLIAGSIIALIPSGLALNNNITGLVSMLSVAFQFFPIDVWIAVFGSITFWVSVHFVYGIINFILKLIPFVNMGQ